MEKKIVLPVLILCQLLLGWHWFEPAARKNLQGIEAYKNRQFETALNDFLSAKGIKPDLPELKNNTASALYQMEKYKEALEEFSGIESEKANIPASQLFYNIGNSFFKMEQYDKALDSYKKSLLADPTDMDAKKNFEYTLKKIDEQNKQQNQQQNKDQQDKKDQEDKKQDQKDQEQNQDQQKSEQQQQQQKPEEKHQNLMQYLNQNEKQQLEKKKRAVGIAKKEKDW